MGATNYPIPTIINIAFLTAVFSDRDKVKQRSFKRGSKTPSLNLPMLLHMEASLLQWYNTNFSLATDLDNVANYVLGLCANYLGEALISLGNAGGIVINPTTGNPINLAFYRADFTIGQAGSLMDAGDIGLTIALSGFLRDSIEMYPGGVNATIGDPTQFSINSVTYNAAYVIIHLNQAVQTGERYIITGLRATAGTVTGGGGTTGLPIPLPLVEGAYLTNDGLQVLWDSPNITYTSADFESDGITVVDARLAIHDYDLWLESPQSIYLVPGVDWISIDGGGYQVLLAEFDATINDYTLTAKMKGAT